MNPNNKTTGLIKSLSHNISWKYLNSLLHLHKNATSLAMSSVSCCECSTFWYWILQSEFNNGNETRHVGGEHTESGGLVQALSTLTDWCLNTSISVFISQPADQQCGFANIMKKRRRRKKRAVMFAGSFPLAWRKTETEPEIENYYSEEQGCEKLTLQILQTWEDKEIQKHIKDFFRNKMII